jgi:macrolide transport system ATP-binding/permease protein
MSTQLTIRSVTKCFAHRRVLDSVSATVRPGERVGVVGENGSGKSTLLRLVVGRERPDDGEVVVSAPGGVGHLGQVLDLPEHATVGAAVDAALADIRDLQQRIADLEQRLDETNLATYGDLLTALELRDGYRADAKVAAAMSTLGIGHLTPDRPLGTISGGQRARLALAGVLSAETELLLLDEPTNHLDAQALAWLEDRLLAHHGTLVVVTHDRLLLERVATAVLEVDNATITRYGNGYAGYLDEKRAARQRWEQRYAEWLGEIDRWTEWGATTAYQVAPGRAIKDRNKCKYNGDGRRVQASIYTRVRSAAERLDRLRSTPVPKPPDPLRLNAPLSSGAVDGPVVELADVTVAGRLTVEHLTVEAGQRLLVSGENGAGKSTLLAVMSGDLQPDSGIVVHNGRIGYLPQECTIQRPNRTVLAAFAQGRVGTTDEHVSTLMSLGLFGESDLGTPVGSLSVGQQRRLALARLLVRDVDALLLDEPTNHLSLALVEDLEAALADYPGAVVVVSHDRLLRSRWSGEELELRDGRPLLTATV